MAAQTSSCVQAAKGLYFCKPKTGSNSALGNSVRVSDCARRCPVSHAERPRSARRKGSTLRMEQHARSEEHTSELQSLMRISYAVFCLKKKKKLITHISTNNNS